MPRQSRSSANGSLRTEYLPLSELLRRHHPDNSREHDIGALIQSIQRFGFVRDVMLNEEDGLLLYGHGTTTALAEMRVAGMPLPDRVHVVEGEWMIPVTRGLHMDPQEAKAYLIADNRTNELGGWREHQLLDNLIALAQADSLDGVGFDGDDVDRLIRIHHPEMLDLPEGARRSGGKAKKPTQAEGGSDGRALAGKGSQPLTCPACGTRFTLAEAQQTVTVSPMS